MKKKTKKIISERISFPFDFTSKKVSLKYFQDWLKQNIPKGAKDICVELEEEPDYHYENGELLNINTSLVISWKRERK